jgi:alkylation response protein AidB-like acyl-CoA dehydrogenase
MPNFALDSDYVAIRDMARSFTDEKLAPRALEWDEKKYFPVDVIREAAALGIAAIYVREDVGGSDAVRRGADLRGALDRLSLHRRLPMRLAIPGICQGVRGPAKHVRNVLRPVRPEEMRAQGVQVIASQGEAVRCHAAT